MYQRHDDVIKLGCVCIDFLQDQYVFLYQAMFEAYLSEDTEIPVANFKKKRAQLKMINRQTKKSNINAEWEVQFHLYLSRKHNITRTRACTYTHVTHTCVHKFLQSIIV